ncbi:Crp/Fnr family transcriptional regulator [Phenylobacterium sp. J367]|uniref:Crp/Fnr family transcriptional regulator n=1 Tax=Phenylobacterium sp. J367 TaxID=2898435 RepID=UPI002151FBBE|nr:Crp/Fnr family transcriptional regulator [Phenylobacterium sp. J367]MCR5879197.1 Crp/Fnr family transcriptional regulator [Phenylobacterium sp. J367]
MQPEPALAGFIADAFACPADVAEAIARRCADRSFPAHAALIRQGDVRAETFLLVLGLAHAFAYGSEGQGVLLQEYRPGDIFGAVVERQTPPSPTEVRAVEAVRAAVFLALDFLALVELHSCVGLAVSRMLLRQLQAATARMVERTTLSSVGRVYAEILRRAGDARRISPPPVLSDVAALVNTTRETASRAVNDLARRGIIRRDDDALVILSPRRLEELVV